MASEFRQIPDYPVGLCTECAYPEPHRHGFDCEKPCACDGVGALG